jgi:hypothetical protein
MCASVISSLIVRRELTPRQLDPSGAGLLYMRLGRLVDTVVSQYLLFVFCLSLS